MTTIDPLRETAVRMVSVFAAGAVKNLPALITVVGVDISMEVHVAPEGSQARQNPPAEDTFIPLRHYNRLKWVVGQ